jgi:hypothetical protein
MKTIDVTDSRPGWVASADPPPVSNRPTLAQAGSCLFGLLVSAATFYQIPSFASNRTACEVFAWILTIGMLLAYRHGYLALRESGDCQLRTVTGFATGFGLMCLFIPPFHSVDLSCYINRGWLQVHYGLNPYVHAVERIPGWQGDPMFRPYWLDATAPYGFAFEAIAGMLCRLGNGHWLATLLLFKTVSAIAFALTAWVLWQGAQFVQPGVGNEGQPASSALTGLYLFLWNPLILMHSLVNGHNDLWMALPTCLAVYLVMRCRWFTVFAVLMAATLVKYAAAVLFPLTLLYLLKRHGFGKTALSCSLALVVLVMLARPYWPGDWQQFAFSQLGANSTIQNSLAALVYFPYELAIHAWPSLRPYQGLVESALAKAFLTAFIVFCGRLTWMRWRQRSYSLGEYVRDCVLVLFVLVCLASPKYYAWYMGMFFPLALWLPADNRLRRCILAISCAQVLSLTFVAQSHGLNVLAMLVAPLIWSLFFHRMPVISRLRAPAAVRQS